MARENTQIVPIDLRGGCITNETGYVIGPRLRLASNVCWQPFHSTDENTRRHLAIAPTASETPLRTLAAGTHDVATHVLGAKFTAGGEGVIVDEEFDTGHLLVHRETTGALIADTGNALILTPDPKSAALAFWANVATPAMYITHPGLVTDETYQWDGTTFAPYTPANVPGLPAAVSALVNPTVSNQATTGSEVALAAGTYIVTIIGHGSAPKTSEPQTAIVAAGQVVRVITPGVMAGITSYDIYMTAPDQPAATATLQLAGAVAAHTYRISTSGTPASGTAIAYVTTGTAMPSIFKGNTALIVHLDRLWLAKVQSVGNRTLVWFTDPLDPDTIRANNFVDIPDVCVALFRCSASPIDVGAAAHLVFGCFNSFWVLDGDPGAQASPVSVLRRIAFGVGLADSSLVCETIYGAVLLATDGQFYLIPPGGQEMVPIGQANHDVARYYRTTQFSGRGAHASLAWVAPYVYYCPDNLGALWIIDFSQGTPPRWWGPIAHGSLASGARVWSIGPEDGFSGATKVNVGLSSTANDGGFLYQIDVTASVPTDRGATLGTGYIHVPGHLVELRRIVLVTTRRTSVTERTVFVGATFADGTGQTRNVTLPAETLTTSPDVIRRTVVPFVGAVSEFFSVTIAFGVGDEPDLQDAWIEVRVQPKQD